MKRLEKLVFELNKMADYHLGLSASDSTMFESENSIRRRARAQGASGAFRTAAEEVRSLRSELVEWIKSHERWTEEDQQMRAISAYDLEDSFL